MVTRIFDLLDHQLQNLPLAVSLAGKENGAWKTYASAEVVDTACAVSSGLLALGLKKDDKVALISSNRPEWNMCDMGMMQVGVVNVPIYPTLSESEFKFILNDAGVKYVIVSDAGLFQKIDRIKNEVPSLKGIYTFNKVEGAMHWSELTNLGQQLNNKNEIDEIKKGIQPSDLATLIYTSGTTGTPKGVMLTHSNIVSNVLACWDLPPVKHEARALSFLPLCHVYERMLTSLYIYLGISVYYASTTDNLIEYIKEIKPEIFSTVPRLLEKVYDRILEKGKEQRGIKKALFFWALNLGLRYELKGKNGWWYELQLSIANKLVFVKWREALGGNVKAIVSGGAALQPRLARVFWSAKIVVLEGYGLTETSPVIAVNNTSKPDAVRFATVGPVIPDVQVKIAEDGEVLVKGPNIMKGYYKRDDLTKEVIDAEGYFHTGDIGTLVENRFLKITDRKKEIFKTSGGKYIAPQALENKFKESLFIEQIMVIGENKKFPAALIVPAFAFLKKWCEEKGIAFTSNAEVIKNNEVIGRIKKEVDEMNLNFGQVEQIKKFELLDAEWTPDSGDLTPTLKLKRKIIAEKNKKLIDKIYGE